jgi:TolA-binding protein
MKVKTKNVKPNPILEHRASLNAFRILCCSFVSFCFLTSLACAQTRSEQLTPTDFLMPYLEKTLQDVNTPAVKMQAAKVNPIDFLMPYLEKTLQDVNTPAVKMQDAKVNPIDFLMPYLEKTLQDVNTPAVQMQAAKLQPSKQEKPQTSDIVAVNFADEFNQKLPQISAAIPGNPTTNIGRQLWRAGISVYEGERDNKRKNELKRLIEQVRSIEFKPPKQPEPFITIEPVPTKIVEPNQTPSDIVVIEESSNKTIESKLLYEPVTDRTLQMLDNVAQDPNQLENPFELGEVLYFSGHLKQAAVFYQEALNRTDPDKPGLTRNRAWILFQIGNCLKDDDLTKAQNMYRQLIAECPGSPWVEPAKAREKLIDWFLKVKPQTLIAEPQL